MSRKTPIHTCPQYLVRSKLLEVITHLSHLIIVVWRVSSRSCVSRDVCVVGTHLSVECGAVHVEVLGVLVALSGILGDWHLVIFVLVCQHTAGHWHCHLQHNQSY